MDYYFDTEFHEFKKKPLFGKPIDTIELISIGIVSEDDREYYAICNEFDLKAAWNNEWLRDNVLLPIAYELARKDYDEKGAFMAEFGNYNNWEGHIKRNNNWYKIWKKRTFQLINKYGKSKKTIASEILDFTGTCQDHGGLSDNHVKFYAYYADYDWVVFCWLFGRMTDLPNGFPKYCIDLKQEVDNTVEVLFHKQNKWAARSGGKEYKSLEEGLEAFKGRADYPTQENAHNALDDAKWNLKLHQFLKTV